jgi:hypothetical protein
LKGALRTLKQMMGWQARFAQETRLRMSKYFVMEITLLTFNARLDYIFMTARNNYIEKLVRGTHAKLFNNRHLSVFCISNKMYKKNRKRVRVHDWPIKGSGVPALRNHCHKIPAQAQFRIAHHFLTVRLKGLAETVQLWLAGGSEKTMPNDSTVQRMLGTLQDDLQQVWTTLV